MILERQLTRGPVSKKGAYEFSSACPECGGRDRFVIKTDGRERYWCRQCGIKGDAIEYLMRFDGMTYREAARTTGKDISSPARQRSGHRQPQAPPKAPPPPAWLERARSLTDFCHQTLMHRPDRLQWLQVERGLNEQTARRFKLGWNGRDTWQAMASWGLPPEKREDGRKKKVFIPSGLVIPGPGRVRIRRDNPGEHGRYLAVKGSGSAPLVIGRDLPADCLAVVIESELDGMLLSQEFSRQYLIVALGSTSNVPSPALLNNLRKRPMVLICMDNDDPGRVAAGKLRASLPNGWMVHLPGGCKDPGEAFKAGHDLDRWRQQVEEQIQQKRGY